MIPIAVYILPIFRVNRKIIIKFTGKSRLYICNTYINTLYYVAKKAIRS
jgi:hypothetical protein